MASANTRTFEERSREKSDFFLSFFFSLHCFVVVLVCSCLLVSLFWLGGFFSCVVCQASLVYLKISVSFPPSKSQRQKFEEQTQKVSLSPFKTAAHAITAYREALSTLAEISSEPPAATESARFSQVISAAAAGSYYYDKDHDDHGDDLSKSPSYETK